jgi:hypothetical protein
LHGGRNDHISSANLTEYFSPLNASAFLKFSGARESFKLRRR